MDKSNENMCLISVIVNDDRAAHTDSRRGTEAAWQYQ